MDWDCKEGSNADKECEAVGYYCWDDDEGTEDWWNDECSLCRIRMGEPLPERCPWCGARVINREDG